MKLDFCRQALILPFWLPVTGELDLANFVKLLMIHSCFVIPLTGALLRVGFCLQPVILSEPQFAIERHVVEIYEKTEQRAKLLPGIE